MTSRSSHRPAPDPLSPYHELRLARGPFHLEDELTLMRCRGIAVVVSENSGAEPTYAKIDAAHELGLRAVMVREPLRPLVAALTTRIAAGRWVEESSR